MHFLLVFEDEPVGWFGREKYEAGYIFEEIPKSERRPGRYRIEAYKGRSKLASTEFVIVDETNP